MYLDDFSAKVCEESQKAVALRKIGHGTLRVKTNTTYCRLIQTALINETD